MQSGISTIPDLHEAGDQEPASERFPRASLSHTLWGIDWSKHLPLTMEGGIVARSSTFEHSLPFVREHYAAIFQEDGSSPFSTTRVSSQKERYYRLAGDFFEFKDGDTTIGLLLCTPIDWSSYYIRSAAVLPEYQRKGLVHGLLSEMFVHLKVAGVERVEADASPSNFATMGILARLFFNVTGTTVTDRWGAHVHLTRFLDEQCEEVFLSQFCAGVRHQGRIQTTAAR